MDMLEQMQPGGAIAVATLKLILIFNTYSYINVTSSFNIALTYGNNGN